MKCISEHGNHAPLFLKPLILKKGVQTKGRHYRKDNVVRMVNVCESVRRSCFGLVGFLGFFSGSFGVFAVLFLCLFLCGMVLPDDPERSRNAERRVRS